MPRQVGSSSSGLAVLADAYRAALQADCARREQRPARDERTPQRQPREELALAVVGLAVPDELRDLAQGAEHRVRIAQPPARARGDGRIAFEREEQRRGTTVGRHEAEQLACAEPQRLLDTGAILGEPVRGREPPQLVEQRGLVRRFVEAGRAPQRRHRPTGHHPAEQHVPAHRWSGNRWRCSPSVGATLARPTAHASRVRVSAPSIRPKSRSAML